MIHMRLNNLDHAILSVFVTSAIFLIEIYEGNVYNRLCAEILFIYTSPQNKVTRVFILNVT